MTDREQKEQRMKALLNAREAKRAPVLAEVRASFISVTSCFDCKHFEDNPQWEGDVELKSIGYCQWVNNHLPPPFVNQLSEAQVADWQPGSDADHSHSQLRLFEGASIGPTPYVGPHHSTAMGRTCNQWRSNKNKKGE